MLHNYFYDAQLRAYLLQFCAIFSELKVQTGKGTCDEPLFISVPCVMGSKDRVVAALFAGNTKNRTFSVPTMAAYMTSLAMAPERRRAPSYVDEFVTMKVGGVFPDDLTVIKRVMPVPYEMQVSLSILASNQQQMHQILEQILVVFNPDIQIQKTDGVYDWTKLSRVELTDISNEENYPSATERRILAWTLTFSVPIYLSLPYGVKDDLVREIKIRISDTSQMRIQEVDENGNLVPFGTPFTEIIVTERTNEGPIPNGPVPI